MTISVGAICHIELFARDLRESAAFYSQLFGWTSSPHDAGYLFWKDPDGNSGGFTTAGAPCTNPAATVYIKVDDIPAALERVVAARGHGHPPENRHRRGQRLLCAVPRPGRQQRGTLERQVIVRGGPEGPPRFDPQTTRLPDALPQLP